MTKWFMLLLLVFAMLKGFTQKNFEGEITYKNISNFKNEKGGIIKVLTKGKKLLISNEYKNDEPIVYTLYDFEKGKSYNLMIDDSVVISSSLANSFFSQIIDSTVKVKSILNFDCSKYTYKILPPISNFISSFDAYFSNKISFEVPINMCGIVPPNILLNGKSISLRTVIKKKGDSKLSIPDVDIEFVADAIIEKELENSLFEVPVYLKPMSTIQYSEFMLTKLNKLNPEIGFPSKNEKKFIKKVNKQLKKESIPTIPKNTKIFKPAK